MSEYSMPWADGAGDGGPYSSETWDDLFEVLFTTDQAATEGVIAGRGGELEVTGTASPVSVATGAAVVKGKIYINTAAVGVSVPTPTGDTRYDRIVLQADYSARTVRIARLEGSEGGSAPSLTQTDGTKWEIPLAQLEVQTDGSIVVTDQRAFAHFGTRVSTDGLEDAAVTTAKLASNVLPSGVIMMYSGAWNFDSTGLGTGDLAGWALCNGQNGTPDLRDRFVLGAGASGDLGQTGGAETQQATIPAHHHNVDIPAFTSGSGGGSRDVKKESDPNWVTTAAVPGHTHTINPPATDTSDVALTSNAFSIVPPYLKLAYIMKL